MRTRMNDTPLFVLPGIAGGFSAQRGFGAALAAAGLTDREVVGFDLPGMLREHAPDSIDELVGSAVDAIDRQDAPVDVMGESIGATVAVRVAAARPDLVRSLILVAPVGFARTVSTPTETSQVSDAITALYVDHEQPVAGALGAFVSPHFQATPEQVREYSEYRVEDVQGAARMVAAWWSVGAFDSAGVVERHDDLRAVRQPVQLVWGRDDDWTGLDSAFFLLRRLRTVQLRVIPSCGHLVSLEAPRVLGRIVQTFLGLFAEPDPVTPPAGG